VQRIVVVGCSGSGKTTLARHLARALGLAHIELDSIYHQANWTSLPADVFPERVAARVEAASGWIADGNYDLVGEWLQQLFPDLHARRLEPW